MCEKLRKLSCFIFIQVVVSVPSCEHVHTNHDMFCSDSQRFGAPGRMPNPLAIHYLNYTFQSRMCNSGRTKLKTTFCSIK